MILLVHIVVTRGSGGWTERGGTSQSQLVVYDSHRRDRQPPHHKSARLSLLQTNEKGELKCEVLNANVSNVGIWMREVK